MSIRCDRSVQRHDNGFPRIFSEKSLTDSWPREPAIETAHLIRCFSLSASGNNHPASTHQIFDHKRRCQGLKTAYFPLQASASANAKESHDQVAGAQRFRTHYSVCSTYESESKDSRTAVEPHGGTQEEVGRVRKVQARSG